MDLITYALLKNKVTNIENSLGTQETELPEESGGVTTFNKNTEYYLGTQSQLNISFLDVSESEEGDWCFICFTAILDGTLTLDNNCVGDTEIELETGKTYEILATYNGTNWVVSYLCY